MEIGVLGLNHQTASVAQLEQVALTETRRIDFMLGLLDKEIDEAVIVSTCGRTEVYFACKKETTDQTFHVILNGLKKISQIDTIEDLCYKKRGSEAIEHMIQVSLGLDSIVLGEDQIIGQMKTAHQVAKDLGCTGRILNVVFRDAIASAKRIKTTLKISEIPLSLSYVGVKVLAERFGDLKEKRILVVGLGEMGQLAIANALALGARVTVTNRSLDRVRDIEALYPQVTSIPYDKRYLALSEFDALISATAAPHMVFTCEHFEAVSHPMVLLDLSLPKDIDDGVTKWPHISLINLDTLAATVDSNKAERQRLVDLAHQMISEHVDKIVQWMAKAQIHYTLKGINDLLKESHDDALRFVDAKAKLDRHQRGMVDKAIEAALKRLVRRPIQLLNQLDNEEERKVANYWLHKLFLGEKEENHLAEQADVE